MGSRLDIPISAVGRQGAYAEHYPACLPPHLLQQPGQGRDEPQDPLVSDGPFRHQRDNERLHPSGPGGCGGGDGQDEGGRRSTPGAGEALRGDKIERDDTENVQSGLNGRAVALHLRVEGFFFVEKRCELW